MKLFNQFRVYQSSVESLQENDTDKVLRKMFNNGTDDEEAADMLHEILFPRPASDPSISSWSSWGFSAPSFFEDRLALTFEGCTFFFAEKRERLLPGDVLKRAVAEEIAELQRKQEEPVNKKQVAEIKDVVVARLLPKSHIKARVVPMMFTQVGDKILLYVFTSSAKIAEDCTALLRSANGCLPLIPFGNEFLHPMESFLTDVLRDPLSYKNFTPAHNAVLFDREMGVVSYKDAALEIEENETLCEQLDMNFICRKLQMRFAGDPSMPDEHLLFTLDAKGSFSGVKFSNMLEDRTRNDDTTSDARTYFQAYGFILSRTLNDMLWKIRSVMAVGEAKAVAEGRIIEFPQSDVKKDFPLIEQAGDDEDDDEL